MFTAENAVFFDASGTKNEIALAIAGYLFTRDNSLEFEKRWNELLKNAGLEYFRMTEFVNNSDQFASWGDRRSQKGPLFEALTLLIKKYSDRAFGCVVLLGDYNAINATYELSEILQPYPLLGYGCIKKCHAWAISQNRMPIISYFESGDTHQDQLRKITNELRPELRPIFIPKRIAPLQAADIAAWDLGNVATKITQGAGYDIWRKSHNRLRKMLQNPDCGIHTRKDLNNLCIDLKIPLRS